MCQFEYWMLLSHVSSFMELYLWSKWLDAQCLFYNRKRNWSFVGFSLGSCFYLLGTAWDHMCHMFKACIGWSGIITCRKFGIIGHQRYHWIWYPQQLLESMDVLGPSSQTCRKICHRCWKFTIISNKLPPESCKTWYVGGNMPKYLLDKWLVFCSLTGRSSNLFAQLEFMWCCWCATL